MAIIYKIGDNEVARILVVSSKLFRYSIRGRFHSYPFSDNTLFEVCIATGRLIIMPPIVKTRLVDF